MVRTYKKIREKPNYSAEDLAIVLREIRSGRMTIYKASRSYKIPYCTLYSRLKGLRGVKKNIKGRLTALTMDQEIELATGITTMEKWGFGLSRKEILEIVAEFVIHNEIKTPFKDGKPGPDWFISFKRRHGLSLKKPQSVEFARKKATDPFVIYNYFTLLKQTLDELQLANKPSQIWNLDESSFSIDPSRTKVVGKRGVACSRVTSTSGRENTTVSMLANAAGIKAPPLIIFKGANSWDQWQAPYEIFPGLSYAASPKGWMDANIFVNYFQHTVIPALGNERPQLIIYDGHSTHVTPRVIALAQEENITILKLPPHTTHLLQPLDLAVFKSVKTIWDQKLVTWQRHNLGRKLPKKMFSTFIAETWKETKAAVIINGFAKAGIMPFNNQVVPREKFDLDALKRWDAQNVPGPIVVEEANIEIELPTQENTIVSTNSEENSSVPSTSAGLVQSSPGVTFENLLLKCVRQHQQQPKVSKRKIASGAEVITAPKCTQSIGETKKTSAKMDVADDSSSESGDQAVSYQESDNEEEFWEDMRSQEEENTSSNESQVLEPGKWVLVQYTCKKSQKHFVGQLKEKGECDEWLIKFLRCRKTKFIWPDVDDEDTVNESNILRVLPEPQDDRRGSGFIFPVKFHGYNIM